MIMFDGNDAKQWAFEWSALCVHKSRKHFIGPIDKERFISDNLSFIVNQTFIYLNGAMMAVEKAGIDK